ncbi:hypothetical protein GCM10009809_09650 [Isoptericola hypogeus]|uniref:L,D-TPase catalytic domain-containing protein n=1 Tax=Isoptericola hypogeus TaxID=300179 RepID=A0ABN2J0J6_9MICO
MRTVPGSRRRRTAPRLGVPAALAAVLTLLVAGCAPTGDGTEPEPGAAPSVEASATPSDTVGSPSTEPTTASPGATGGESATTSPEDDAAREAAEKKAADKKAAAKKAAEEKAAEEKAEQEAAEQEAAEQEAAEQEAAEQEAAEQAAAEKAAQEAAEARDRMLEYGDTGDRVVALQERLQDLGYFLQDADGSFGPATQQAVWALQKAAGQYRDGVVGPKTQAALDDGVRPSAVSSSGKVVEIDIGRQLLLAVQDGVVQRTFNASSGNEVPYEAKGVTYPARTTKGTFSIYKGIDGMHTSTLELGDMYRPKYFNGGIAVHGSPSIPPYPASHGCVRLSNSAISWLWDSWGLPNGTTVIVR